MSNQRADSATATARDQHDLTLSAIAAAIGQDSELVTAARQVAKRRENVLGLLLRDLTHQEVAIMEGRGCRCDDWSQVAVAQDFDPFRVRRTHFKGSCVLGRFSGDVDVAEGITLPAGIYDCTVIDSQIGNDCLIENVRFMANTVVERNAVVFDCGSITCSGAAKFGCGQALALAIETGGREVPLWAEINVAAAAAIARDRGDHAGQQAVRDAVASYVEQITSPVGWIRRGALVRHAERLHDTYIGIGAQIRHTVGLLNVAVLSAEDEVTDVSGGATLRDSVVQWGSTISGNAIMRNAVLCEHSGIDENGIVQQSLIGPNTTIAKGEVTSSLVGPFVGFHHQSLLISAYWPEGKGNVAYGAMVGSNHTGRAPDQEIWAGEGTFFGLGCSIRFPADFSQSPYSVISAGVSCLPQKLRFPFSLVTTPAEAIDEERVPRAYNEIIPGWVLHTNAYGIERMELKFAKRDKSRRHKMHYQVLRPSIMRLVLDALDRLEQAEQQDLYLEDAIPGVGKNFIREDYRRKGVEAYERVLKRYGLRILLGEAEGNEMFPGSVDIAHELIDRVMPGVELKERLEELVRVEEMNAEIVERSRQADDARGVRIIPGYAEAHGNAGEDPVVRSAWQRARSTADRVAKVLG